MRNMKFDIKGLAKDALGTPGVGASVGTLSGGLIADGKTSGVGNFMNTASTLGSSIPGPTGQMLGAGLGFLGGVTNALMGSKVNAEEVSRVEGNIAQLANFQTDASDNDSLMDDIQNMPALAAFSRSQIGSGSKARNLYNSLKRRQENAYNYAERNISNAADNIAALNNARMNSQWFSFGGDLQTHGGDFPTGLLQINEGGSHEENPNGGVQMGIDSQGTPNYVEEGETIYDDYVFSKRLEVPEELRKEYKLGGKLSFAEASKKLAKDVDERPNDYISKNTFMASMEDLRNSQEEVKYKQQLAETLLSNLLEQAIQAQQPTEEPLEQEVTEKPMEQFAKGGKLGNYYDYAGVLDTPLAKYKTPGLIMADRVNKALKTSINTPDGYTAPKLSSPLSDNNAESFFNLKSTDAPKELETKRTVPILDTRGRYAPIAGSLLSVLQNGLQGPDLTSARVTEEAAKRALNINRINARNVGTKLKYTPYDTNYLTNTLTAQANAGLRTLSDLSGGNSARATAGMLAANSAALNQLGEAQRKSREFNDARLKETTAFNNDLEKYAAESSMRADMFNAEAQRGAYNTYLTGITQAQALRNAAVAQKEAAINANMTNLFDNIGAIGKENMAINMINTNPANKGYMILNTGQITRAKGGKLKTIKRR